MGITPPLSLTCGPKAIKLIPWLIKTSVYDSWAPLVGLIKLNDLIKCVYDMWTPPVMLTGQQPPAYDRVAPPVSCTVSDNVGLNNKRNSGSYYKLIKTIEIHIF